MSIDANSLKEQVIKPTLLYLNEKRSAAIELLLATAAVETQLKPLSAAKESDDSTCGMGLYNVTRQQHLDVWDNYLAFDPDLASKIRGLASQRTFLTNPHDELNTNLAYATAIAWCIYKRTNLPLTTDSTQYLASCWSRYFRHEAPPINQAKFCSIYRNLVLDTPSLASNSRNETIDAA